MKEDKNLHISAVHLMRGIAIFFAIMVFGSIYGQKRAVNAVDSIPKSAIEDTIKADENSNSATIKADENLNSDAIKAGEQSVSDTLKAGYSAASDSIGRGDSVVSDSIKTQTTAATDTRGDITGQCPDIMPTDSTEMKKSKKKQSQQSNAIDDVVSYQSSDSLVLTGNGTAFLHGKGNIKYKTMDLTSEYIKVKMDSSTIFARGVYDSIDDKWIGQPVFAEGEDKYESNELTYNLKTQKGFIRHVVTQQGEGWVISEKTKKMEGDVMMMADGKYTTCDDHEHPHFYLALTKAKVKPKGYIATGPAYLVVGDVPLPLAIPFGFFPFTDKYSSGLIMPTFGDDRTRGLYLRGLGYYFAINDYVDLQVTGDIYTKGTWAISAQSNYVWRYHFRGNLNFEYRKDVTGEKGMPDYSAATNMSIRWTHTQDQKANPYSTFSASVNFSTSGYNRSNINSYYNVKQNSENTKSSSISYTQRFPDAPWTITASASITQRTKDSTLTLSLPDVSISMSTVKPFKRKKALGKEKWYEKIQLSYRGNIKNSITCKENYLFHSNFVRDWKNGVSHSIPISASFNLFKYITLSPSINYNEKWVFQRIDQSWDNELNQVHRDTTNGFYRLWDVSGSLSMSTKIYGFYIPVRKLFGDKVDRFRHVITPSISFSYRPDFTELQKKTLGTHYYDTYQRPYVDKASGDTLYETVNYSRFQGAAYSPPGQGSSGNLSFSVGNNLEVKVRNDKDTTGKNPYKVISLIDNLSISGGYNFLADSMNWSLFSVNLRIKLPKPLNYTINLSGNFDPYMYELNAFGNPVRTNKQYWHNKKFLNFLGTGTSFSYTFNNQTFKKLFDKIDERRNKGKAPTGGEGEETEGPDLQAPPDLTETAKPKRDSGSEADERDGFHKTQIDWSLSLNYSVRYGENRSSFNYEKMKYNMMWTHNLSISGTLNLGKGWKVSATTSYDFKAKQFTYTNFNVSRDLHCWSMSASFVPFGPYKSYNFHIGVNASMLSDLKYDKSSAESTNKRTDWW